MRACSHQNSPQNGQMKGNINCLSPNKANTGLKIWPSKISNRKILYPKVSVLTSTLEINPHLPIIDKSELIFKIEDLKEH